MQKDVIAYGTSQTSSVMTSARLILAATFVALTGLPLQMLLQFGLVTAIGVLIDTSIVRPFLVPSITALLGERALWPLHAKHDEEAMNDTGYPSVLLDLWRCFTMPS